jgi:hypothetical protein
LQLDLTSLTLVREAAVKVKCTPGDSGRANQQCDRHGGSI